VHQHSNVDGISNYLSEQEKLKRKLDMIANPTRRLSINDCDICKYIDQLSHHNVLETWGPDRALSRVTHL